MSWYWIFHNWQHNCRTFCVCVKRITLCNCLCSSAPFSSRGFSSLIRNIGKFGAKNYFTDHRKVNTIYGFRDLVSWYCSHFQIRCLLYMIFILFIRCKFYAVAVISLQHIVTMFIIILYICISIYVFIVYTYTRIFLQYQI